MNHFDVIIIGAGPTGLMAANQLAKFDINFCIIDSNPGPTEESRAIVVTARSMEIYQQMGLSDTAISEGRFITDLSIYIKGKEKAAAHIGEFGKGLTDFSYMLAFEQSHNEKLLVKNLATYNYSVRWNLALENINQQKENIALQVKHLSEPGQPVETLTADYIIGCDGAKSLTRHLLNFTFEGGTYEKQFYVADSKIKWQKGFNRLVLCPGRKNFCAFFPMGGSNSHRIIGTIPAELNDRENITFDDIQHSIIDTAKFPLEIEKINWFSVYKLHHRSVDTFRKGNCFLAGDAAHIHSPAGGQGMNTGLQDAYNLAWKLAMVVKKKAHTDLLETYNEERLPFAKWLLKFTDRAFEMMTSSNFFIAWVRNNIIPILVNIFFKKQSTRTGLFKSVSQIQWTYKQSSVSQNSSLHKLKFNAGDRLPYLLIKDESIYKLLTAPCFHLLMIGDDKPTIVSNEIIKVIHLDLREWQVMGVIKPLYILVRPDNYIGLITDKIDEVILTGYLRAHCHFI